MSILEIIELAKINLQAGPEGTRTHAQYLDFNARGLTGVWNNPELRKHFVDETRLADFLRTVKPDDTETQLLLRLADVVLDRPYRYEDWQDWDVNADYATNALPRDWHSLLESNRGIFLKALVQSVVSLRDETHAVKEEEQPSQNGGICQLRKRDTSWEVTFEGKVVYCVDMVGFIYVAELLRRPDEDIAAVELVRLGRPTGQTSASAAKNDDALHDDTQAGDRDGDPALDQKALDDIKADIERLNNERDALIAVGKIEEAAKKDEERDSVIKFQTRSLNKAGRVRRLGSNSEKDRLAVRNAINRAIDKIDQALPAAAAWLKPRTTTGVICRFSSSL